MGMEYRTTVSTPAIVAYSTAYSSEEVFCVSHVKVLLMENSASADASSTPSIDHVFSQLVYTPTEKELEWVVPPPEPLLLP